MKDPYIERPLLGSDGMAKLQRKSRENVSMKTLLLSMLFGIIFVALLAGNVYQNALVGLQTRPSIRLRARSPVPQSNTPSSISARINDSEFFNMNSKDVIVFLQIQNAGANFFEKRLVEDLDLERPCDCQNKRRICNCLHPNSEATWLFSRITSGWKCGVHPDWTELTSCVDRVLDEQEGVPIKRRYFYMTMLRDPVKRFRTEWQRYTTNRGSRPQRHLCGGHETTLPDVSICFKNVDPSTVTLEQFANCETNLALNRQTRMLADLTLVNCYRNTTMSPEHRNMLLLHSAKSTLHKMAYFGLAEFPKVSQKMFESSFGLRFMSEPHKKFNRLSKYLKNTKRFSTEETDIIRKSNALDVELYEYAQELLFQRFSKLKQIDPSLSDDKDEDSEDSDYLADLDDLFPDR